MRAICGSYQGSREELTIVLKGALFEILSNHMSTMSTTRMICGFSRGYQCWFLAYFHEFYCSFYLFCFVLLDTGSFHSGTTSHTIQATAPVLVALYQSRESYNNINYCSYNYARGLESKRIFVYTPYIQGSNGSYFDSRNLTCKCVGNLCYGIAVDTETKNGKLSVGNPCYSVRILFFLFSIKTLPFKSTETICKLNDVLLSPTTVRTPGQCIFAYGFAGVITRHSFSHVCARIVSFCKSLKARQMIGSFFFHSETAAPGVSVKNDSCDREITSPWIDSDSGDLDMILVNSPIIIFCLTPSRPSFKMPFTTYLIPSWCLEQKKIDILYRNTNPLILMPCVFILYLLPCWELAISWKSMSEYNCIYINYYESKFLLQAPPPFKVFSEYACKIANLGKQKYKAFKSPLAKFNEI